MQHVFVADDYDKTLWDIRIKRVYWCDWKQIKDGEGVDIFMRHLTFIIHISDVTQLKTDTKSFEQEIRELKRD